MAKINVFSSQNSGRIDVSQAVGSKSTAGPAGAHKLMNRAESTARMMMFSNERVPAVSVYPDSDKIGVWPDDDANGLIFKRTTAVPYDEDEEGWENAS